MTDPNEFKDFYYDDGDVPCGLTKREYLAAQALTGILTQGLATGRTAARTAVNVADELINALNEENE